MLEAAVLASGVMSGQSLVAAALEMASEVELAWPTTAGEMSLDSVLRKGEIDGGGPV